MYRDRRYYQRVNLNKECVLYLGEIELNCIIKDISENGISFIIYTNEEFVLEISKYIDENINFCFLDEFDYMNKHIKQVITGKSRIKRIQELENKIVLGCILESDKLIENYVLKKKTCEFMSYYCK